MRTCDQRPACAASDAPGSHAIDDTDAYGVTRGGDGRTYARYRCSACGRYLMVEQRQGEEVEEWRDQ
ncbi:MAG: hypothetical protein M3O34_00225 [Chloroflexota bacterium]|nr:hypothetical protein [Chloroflexota bacterium]